MLSVLNKRNSFHCCPVYGSGILRKSEYASFGALLFISAMFMVYALQAPQSIIIPTQVPKAQSIQLRFVEVNPLEYIKPETNVMLAKNSEYKVLVPQELEKKVPQKNQVKDAKPLEQKPKVTQKEVKPILKEITQIEKEISKPVLSQSDIEAQVQTASQEEIKVKQHALGILLHTLEEHKRYPKAARRIQAEGTIPLLFSINAQGVVTGYSIKKNDAPMVLLRAAKALGEKVIGLNIHTNTRKSFQVIVPIAYDMSHR